MTAAAPGYDPRTNTVAGGCVVDSWPATYRAAATEAKRLGKPPPRWVGGGIMDPRSPLGQAPTSASPPPAYGNPPPACPTGKQPVFDQQARTWACLDTISASTCPSGYEKSVSTDRVGVQRATCVPTAFTTAQQQTEAAIFRHWPWVAGGLAILAGVAAGRGHPVIAITSGLAAAGVAGVGTGVILVPMEK